jgi:hypothetical protein
MTDQKDTDKAMRFPSPESNSQALETRSNPIPKRESNSNQQQSPFTRSINSQISDKSHKSSKRRANSRVCNTELGHIADPQSVITNSNHLGKRSSHWVTGVGHNSPVRGLSLRGNVYQFRIRVPADLRAVMGCSHVKRSLRTDSRSLAIRLSDPRNDQG